MKAVENLLGFLFWEIVLLTRDHSHLVNLAVPSSNEFKRFLKSLVKKYGLSIQE